MTIRKALIIEDVWEFEDEGEATSKDLSADALVAVDGGGVTIRPHHSDQDVLVVFTRDEFAEIVKLVNSVPPAPTAREE